MKFEDYPIRHGTKINDDRYKTDRYKFTFYANDLEARAINYILNSWMGGRDAKTGKKQTMTDIIIAALQQRQFAPYWKPFENIIKKRKKAAKSKS